MTLCCMYLDKMIKYLFRFFFQFCKYFPQHEVVYPWLIVLGPIQGYSMSELLLRNN